MRVFSGLCLAGFVALLAGCADVGRSSTGAVEPVQQQATSNDARARAKNYTELGLAYFDANRLTPALEAARSAIKIDPAYPMAYSLQGTLYQAMRENATAETAFLKALSLAPGDPDISNSYGWFLCQTGREHEAMDQFKRALGNPLYTRPVAALNNMAQCSVRLRDEPAAEEALAQSLRLEPNNAQTLYLQAEQSFRLYRNNETRVRLAELHQRHEPTAASIWLAIRVAVRANDADERDRYAAILAKKYPESPEMELLNQGRFE